MTLVEAENRLKALAETKHNIGDLKDVEAIDIAIKIIKEYRIIKFMESAEKGMVDKSLL